MAIWGEKYRARVSGTQLNLNRRNQGVGLIDNELKQAKEEVEVDVQQLAAKRKKRALEKKIREARAWKGKLEKGEKLEATAIAKARNLENWEEELKRMLADQ